MLTIDDWRIAVRETADELRQTADVWMPPVDAIRIAQSSRLAIAVDGTQTSRGRIKRIAGRPTIFLRPEERPERLQWAAAHELGESQIGRICRSLRLDPCDLSSRQREELANQMAHEILLPWCWFRRDCQSMDYDLPRLKARYATASHELIAWRWLDLEQPACVSIFDQGRLTRRRGNHRRDPPSLTELEQRGLQRLRQSRQPVRCDDSRWSIRGWCVDSPDWQREILLTIFPGESETVWLEED